ncbi:hypothetical protein VTJ04DRAFT_5108 [Mycothermus thermophilus]|uniref:uncharacterized protein n=1 Tax=Humicola insolens TaxID=85995 RepID=UPI0037420E48
MADSSSVPVHEPAKFGPEITIGPAPGYEHTHTMIFLHGRGDNIKSFTRSLHAWYSTLGLTLFTAYPSMRFVFPQAPLRPLASTGGREIWTQWFDVWTPRDFEEREEVQIPGLRESVGFVKGLVEREVKMLDGRMERVLLAGISMGGATGVHTFLNLDLDVPKEEGEGKRLGAFLAFCARCPFAKSAGERGLGAMRAVLKPDGAPDGEEEEDNKKNEVIRNTPVMLQHCADDPLVPVERGRELCKVLERFGAKVEWREFPIGGHWFHAPEGIDELIEFLDRAVFGWEREREVEDVVLVGDEVRMREGWFEEQKSEGSRKGKFFW